MRVFFNISVQTISAFMFLTNHYLGWISLRKSDLYVFDLKNSEEKFLLIDYAISRNKTQHATRIQPSSSNLGVKWSKHLLELKCWRTLWFGEFQAMAHHDWWNVFKLHTFGSVIFLKKNFENHSKFDCENSKKKELHQVFVWWIKS